MEITNKILFIASISCCIGCNQLSEKKKEGDSNEVKKQIQKTVNSIILSDSLKPIVESLVSFNSVEDSLIGIAAKPSAVYSKFTKLLGIATDSELVQLTDHRNPSVRVYAFWGLAKRHNPVVKSLIKYHITDQAKFKHTEGCEEMENTVNNFYLDILTPNFIDVNCMKLSEDEIKSLRSLIKNN